MNTVNFSTMTTPQLVSFYNRHSTKPVKRFSDRKTAEKRCAELFSSLMSNDSVKVMNQKATPTPAGNTPRPVMQSSLKLDRTITCVETGETWKNAYQMWVSHPDWMTSSQQDRLTAQLYAAAKQGEQKQVVINERTFQLVNVPQVTE
jgi:hypothetical protein